MSMLFDFLKRNNEGSEEDIIQSLMESRLFKMLMTKQARDPTETITICCMVLVFSFHMRGTPIECFETVLELMKRQYEELPDFDLMKSMKEFDLV